MLAQVKGLRVCLRWLHSSVFLQLVKFFLCLRPFDSKSLLAHDLKLLHRIISIGIDKDLIFFYPNLFSSLRNSNREHQHDARPAYELC
jgi:hypothetical protein